MSDLGLHFVARSIRSRLDEWANETASLRCLAAQSGENLALGKWQLLN